jgi:hypothetical protein
MQEVGGSIPPGSTSLRSRRELRLGKLLRKIEQHHQANWPVPHSGILRLRSSAALIQIKCTATNVLPAKPLPPPHFFATRIKFATAAETCRAMLPAA